MSKSMETSNLDKKEAVLSEQSAAFINFLTNCGYLGDKQIDDVKIREAKKRLPSGLTIIPRCFWRTTVPSSGWWNAFRMQSQKS